MVRSTLPVFGIVCLIAACATSTFEGDDKKDGDITSGTSTSSSSTSSSSGGADASKDTGSAVDAAKDTGSTSSSGTIDAGKDTGVVTTVPMCASGQDAVILQVILTLAIPKTSSCNTCNAGAGECCFKQPITNDPYCIPNVF